MLTLSLTNIAPGGENSGPVNFLLTGCP